MTDIPRSVMEEARGILRDADIAYAEKGLEYAAQGVARALLSRDKRAAEIARRYSTGGNPKAVGEAIAKEIERYDTPTGQEDRT